MNNNSNDYLADNYAPLYHLTMVNDLYDILKRNILKRNKFTITIMNGEYNIISLTRTKNFNFLYNQLCDCIIELDKNKLSQNYKIYKYDFSINSKQEDKAKSNIHRKLPFESEEIILKDIKNIERYILSINFLNNSIYDSKSISIIKLLENKNIKILKNGK